jgi:hypothetical protein
MSFNGTFLLVGTDIDKEDKDSATQSISSLNNLADEMRGNLAIQCYHAKRLGEYYVLIPDVSDHHRAILEDFGYTVQRKKYSRQQRKRMNFKPLRINNNDRYRKIL